MCLHLAAHARRGEHQLVRPSRVHAAGEQRRAAGLPCLVEALLRAPPPTGDEVRRAHDVDAVLEEPAHRLDVLLDRVGEQHLVVADHVGLEREQGVDVVGGGDPERCDPDELADVLAHLLGAPRVGAHELHVGMVDDGPPGEAGDVPGGPQHDAIRHRMLPLGCGPSGRGSSAGAHVSDGSATWRDGARRLGSLR